MIFLQPFGAPLAPAMSMTTTSLSPSFSIQTSTAEPLAVLPEDVPRLAAEKICQLRSENRTESEIVDILRKTFVGISDIQIVSATEMANKECPLALTPLTPVFQTTPQQTATAPSPLPIPLPAPSPPEPEEEPVFSPTEPAPPTIPIPVSDDEPLPAPFTPDEPTVVVLPPQTTPASQGGTRNWAIFGGIAVGIVAVGVLATVIAKK